MNVKTTSPMPMTGGDHAAPMVHATGHQPATSAPTPPMDHMQPGAMPGHTMPGHTMPGHTMPGASMTGAGAAMAAPTTPEATGTGLPPAKPTAVIELKDGDTFVMPVRMVEKEINGKKVTMYAYNGSVPGPLIKVKEGAEITLRLVNNTDLPTTLHSHGIRLDNEFDGIPGVTQDPIQPGEIFDYKIKFPDVGTYWYHTHVKEWFTQELGEYGSFLVEPNDPNYYNPVNQEVNLILDDILLNSEGQVDLSREAADHAVMGRFGNTTLVNGETEYQLDVKQGEVVRFYINDVANARPYNFAIPGAKMKLIGSDSGKAEREEWVDSVIISPAERYIVEVLFDKPGTFPIVNKKNGNPTTLGNVVVSDEQACEDFSATFNTLRSNPEITREMDELRSYFDNAPDKRLSLDFSMRSGNSMGGMDHGAMGGMDHGSMSDMSEMDHGSMGTMGSMGDMDHSSMGTMGTMGHNAMGDGTFTGLPSNQSGLNLSAIEWDDGMPGMSNLTHRDVEWKIIDMDTGKVNMDVDWNFQVGDKAVIEIYNDPNSAHPMQHPIHFHGQRFVTYEINGERVDNLMWKDTVLLAPGDRIKLVLDVTNPGQWMAHCHIAEHLEAGMMINFSADEATTLPAAAPAKPVPSLESVKALEDPQTQVAQAQELFSSLAEPTALPTGKFEGDFVGLYSDNALIKALAPLLWDGVAFDGPEARILINPWFSAFLPKETGVASLAPSVYDGRQTIRVDYADRFWETRRLDDNRFLTIVTDKETHEVLDVHTLTR